MREATSATHFFVPSPKRGVPRYEERLLQSLVGIFNKERRERRRDILFLTTLLLCLNLVEERTAKVLHISSKIDYCDFCARTKDSLRRNQTTLNRIRQAGSSCEAEQKIEKEIGTLNDKLKKSYEFYTATTKKCKSEWRDIQLLAT